MLMHRVADDAFLSGLKQDAKMVTWALPESLTHVYHAPIAMHECGFNLLVDLYYRDKRPAASRPALIFLHDWSGGNQPRMCGDRQSSYLALTEGLFCAVLYYRQPEDGRFPAALHDVKCAVRWLRSVAGEYSIAADQIIVMGSSAGSQWAALAAATNGSKGYEGAGGYDNYSSDVNMAVLLSGVYDLVGDFRDWENVRQIMGGTCDEMPGRYHEASPVEHLHPGMPPVLMIHGEQDKGCPVRSAIAAAAKLKSLDVPCELVVRQGAGHDLAGPGSTLYSNLEVVGRFIRLHFRCAADGVR